MPVSIVENIDCMVGMARYPDKYFDLAIVDPPYGIGNTTTSAGNKHRKTLHKRVKWNEQIPSKEYFNELFRISRNQIIWGCNYFYPYISVPGRIVHYKRPFQDLSKNKILFCPCDLASQSFNNRIEYFEYNWYGNTQGGKPNFNNSGPDARIHPTQKPIILYKWLLKKYTKEGDKIIDTHMGSQSSRIACYDGGFDYWGWEIDKDYFNDGNKRFENYKAQLKLF
uniref:Putative methyltransferase n=2 Tax=viral metagenome TaxID=1070528 RepID=A0A6M3LDG2_9ZZZZ